MKGRLLIIEDDSSTRESLAEMFLLYGYKVMVASNGKVGLEIIKSKEVNLVITDIVMPELDGFDILKHLRNEKSTELLPVIIITGQVGLETKLRGLDLGADDYLVKPFEFRELHLKIRNLLLRLEKIHQYGKAVFDVNIKSQEELFMNKFKLIIDENINKNYSVVELADLVGMSPSTLNRKIKKITGKSVIKYINEYKLRKSYEMIKINYGNLTEISQKLGFHSLSYFSKIFKKYYGKKPSDFTPQSQ